MRAGHKAVVAGLLLTPLALGSCGGDTPTPTAPRTPVVVASPTPAPSPTPAKSALPPGMVCGEPTPPPMLRMNVKIHGLEGSRIVFDSKPVVPNTNGYCDKAGFGDWKFCDTRPEGHPDRVACDYLVAGVSPATKRWGPTWYFNDTPCGSNPTDCAHHPSEQFMTIGKSKGTYVACAAETTPVAAGGSRCGVYELK